MKNNIGRKLVFYTHCEDLPEVKYNKTIESKLLPIEKKARCRYEKQES